MIVVPRPVRLLRHLAAQEVTRYSLRNLFLRRRGEDCFAMATDGKRAALLRWKNIHYEKPDFAGPGECSGDEEIQVSAAALARIPAVPRTGAGREDIFVVARRDGGGPARFYDSEVLWVEDREKFLVTSPIDIDGKYPADNIEALTRDPWKAWDGEELLQNLALFESSMKISVSLLKALLGRFTGMPFRISLYRPDSAGKGPAAGIRLHRHRKGSKDGFEKEFEFTLIQMGLTEVA